MSKERELLKKCLDILSLEGYRHTIPEIKDLLAQPEPELIGFVAESSVGFDVSQSVQSMPLLWLGKLEHGDKLYRVGKKGE